MRFGLRRQLLTIGLATMALPLVSISYIRATEQALRETQTDFLTTTAGNVAPLIIGVLDDLPTDPANDPWFVEPLAREPVLDGFRSDWTALTRSQDALIGGPRLRTAAASFNGALFLHADVVHGDSITPNYTVSCLSANGSLLLLQINPEASGTFDMAPMIDGAARPRGVWIPDADGSQLELRIAASPCRRGLGLWAQIGTDLVATHEGSIPGPMLSVDTNLAQGIAENRVAGTEMFAVSVQGWRLTPLIGRLQPEPGTPYDREQSLLERLFEPDRDSAPTADRDFDQRGDWLAPIRDGQPAARRARLVDVNLLVSEVAVPLYRNERVVAALVMRQPTSAVLSLTNPVRTRMTLAVIGVTVAIVLLLLAFATWLSLRVRRLSRAAATAVDSRGRIRSQLPGTAARDEVGDVARGFESLLKRLEEQQTWLQSLADSLSHELRTPIAVVQSSLENLRHSDLAKDAETLVDRAASGVDRLQATLLSMTRANRAEQAVREAEFSEIDLSELLRQLQRAYADTFATHRFTGKIEPNVRWLGSPELLVQMIDKLVENAVTFAPRETEIGLSLRAKDGPTISVENIGSSLPEEDIEHLFMPLVSRRGGDGGAGHLGFGLYIAQLIAQVHNAKISGRNTERGVAFEVFFKSE